MNYSNSLLEDSGSESDSPFAPPKDPTKYAKEEDKSTNDKLAEVKREIDSTKDQVLISIDKAVQRGDELQPLVDKTNELSLKSFSFKRKSQQLRRQVWCDNLQKRTCLIVMILTIVTTIILIIVYSTKKH